MQIKQFQGGLKDKDPLQDVIMFPNPLLPNLSLPEALRAYDVLRLVEFPLILNDQDILLCHIAETTYCPLCTAIFCPIGSTQNSF